MTKSSDAIWSSSRAQAASPYSSTGTHLLLIMNMLNHIFKYVFLVCCD